VEVTEPYNDMRFTPHPISFLTHDIVLQRYFELDGELRTFLTVIKTRARGHSRDMREYKVTSNGIVVGERLSYLQGLITAVPQTRDTHDR
jgi:circadian clock protein KaiC